MEIEERHLPPAAAQVSRLEVERIPPMPVGVVVVAEA